MTPDEHSRLADVEQQLAEVSRKLRASEARVKFLRGLLADADPEAASAEDDAHRILDTISGPSRPLAARPKLRLVEGDRSGERGHVPGRDRHGLRTV
ncbi:hypothetical protein [Streptomyces chartreusis]|uniref:hypothetical protein n=1 Tax=Streptomyces chartreusis TaxID=1969 RepID=UPI003827533B